MNSNNASEAPEGPSCCLLSFAYPTMAIMAFAGVSRLAEGNTADGWIAISYVVGMTGIIVFSKLF